MCHLIEQFASDTGINADDANYIFAFISGHLVSKIPVLSQVIEDVFENADPGKLQEHVNKAIEKMQEQQWREKFKDFLTPPQTHVIIPTGGGSTF